MVSINNEDWYNAMREIASEYVHANMTASNKSHYHFDPLKLISLHFPIGRSKAKIKSKVNEKS